LVLRKSCSGGRSGFLFTSRDVPGAFSNAFGD
jgi:hypothetical protein